MNEETSKSSKNRGARIQMQFRSKSCERSNWSAINIAATVVGFMCFWPVGLAMLFWVLSGRQVTELPEAISYGWARLIAAKNGERPLFGCGQEFATDNVVFNEYQQTQWDRIQEIREDIQRRRDQFADFRSDVKRRADDEEFRRFMNESPLHGDKE